MNTAYVVATGFTLYGPFASVEQAQAWGSHPYRAAETRAEFRVLPLFGGLLIEPEDEPAADDHLCDEECLDEEHMLRRWSRWTGVARP